MSKIVVIGAGAFGTALALNSVRCGHQTTLIARRPEFASELHQSRFNQRYLKDVPLPDTLTITAALNNIKSADMIILATPAQSLSDTCIGLKSQLAAKTPLVIAAKGIDRQRLQLLSTVVSDIVANPVAILSGPSFAIEIAHSLPTAVMLAATDLNVALELSQLLRHQYFRCYASDDVIGVQVAGAVKNIIAIAAGITHGRNLGENASAALLSRGLAEMTRLGITLGGKQETFLGLAGVGDLILTGSSSQSRNFSLGLALGQGQSLEDILAGRNGVTEGIATSAAIIELAKRHQVRMPICQSIYELLHCGSNLDLIIEKLLSKQADLET